MKFIPPKRPQQVHPATHG